MAIVNINLAVELTPKQAEYLPAIRWLINGPRRSGRSTLLAVAYIEQALAYGESIVVRDHHPWRGSDRHLINDISNIVQLTNQKLPKREQLVLRVEGDRIRITGGYDGIKASRSESKGNPFVKLDINGPDDI